MTARAGPDPLEAAAADVAGWLAAAARRLARAGIDSPRLDARLLLMAVLGLDHAGLIAARDRRLGPAERTRAETLLARRAAREPVGRILGRRGFYGLELDLGPDTLEPRPDSETLVTAALDHADARPGGRQGPWRLLDLGTGTGCLLLACLAEMPAATGFGVDIAAGAVATARANARRLGLGGRARFARADFTAADFREAGAVAEATPADMVLANPPYIPAGEIDALAPEVRAHDPRRALDGGVDGLDAHRALAALMPHLLAPGGRAFIEIGAGQGGAVASLLQLSGLAVIDERADLGGHGRCLVARMKPGEPGRDLPGLEA